MTTPGLNYTQSADAPSAADTDNTQDIGSGGGGALVKATGKGISPVGNIAMDPTQTAELLANMQQMVDDRTGAGSQFMRGLERAAAWGSGGVQGPVQALATINAQHQREDESVSNMRQQMAAYRSAAAQNENIGKSLDQMTSGGTGSPGIVEPAVMAEVNRLKGLKRYADAEKFYQTALQEAAKQYTTPGMEKRENLDTVFDPETNSWVTKMVSARELKENRNRYPNAPVKNTSNATTTDPILQRIALAESAGQNIPNASGKSSAYGLYQITNPTFNTIKAQDPALKDLTWDQFKANPEIQTRVAEKLKDNNSKMLQKAGLPDTPLNQYTAWFSGDTKLASAPAETPIASIMSKEQIDANPSLTGKTAGQVRAMLDSALNKAIPSAAAQTRPSKPVSPEAVKQAEDVALDFKKKMAEGSAENVKKEEDTFLKESYMPRVQEQKQLAARLGTLLGGINEKDNKIVGLLNKQGMGPAISKLLVEGISTPVGSVSLKGLEEAYQAALPGTKTEDIEQRREIAQILAQYSLIASQAAQGQGSMSDYERQMFQRIAGSTSDSVGLLKKVQETMAARAEFNETARLSYNKYQQPGKPSDYATFVSKSPEYDAALRRYSERLGALAQGKGDGAKPGNAAPTIGTTSGGVKWKVVQ